MARLPQPGGDAGRWGQILNDYLAVSHNSDGTVKANSITAALVADGAITEAKLDSAVRSKLNNSNADAALTKTVADASYATVLTPVGAVADGVANDIAAFTGIDTSTPGTIRLRKGRAYKIVGNLLLPQDLDMNGATLTVSGYVDLNGYSIWGGTINTGGGVRAISDSYFHCDDITVNVTMASATGVLFQLCTQFTSRRVTINGEAFRGMVIDRCSDWQVEDTKAYNCTAAGAYGIMAYANDGNIYRRGTLIRPVAIDCYFGVTIHGGEADATKSGYRGVYSWDTVTVIDAVAIVTDPTSGLIGCIWATNSRNLTFVNPSVFGGRDVGIDFEHCVDSRCLGGQVVNVLHGALALLFACNNVKFYNVNVSYTLATAGSAATSGVTWKNTSNLQVLLRDKPVNAGFYNCSFSSSGGALGRIGLGEDGSTGLEFIDCTGHNVYMSGANATAGNVKDTRVRGVSLRFDINLNAPAIYHERVLRYTTDDCDVVLASGEVPYSNVRPYICVYDPDTQYSEYVYLRRNRVVNGAPSIVGDIGVMSGNVSINAWILDNLCDRIVGRYDGSARPNIRFSNNQARSGVDTIKMTANDSVSVNVVTAVPYPSLFETTTTTLALTMLYRSWAYTGSATATWTMPTVARNGTELTVRNMGTGKLTLAAATSGTIYSITGVSSLITPPGGGFTFISDGTYWVVKNVPPEGFPSSNTYTTSTTLVTYHQMAFADGSNITITLPDASLVSLYRKFTIKNIHPTVCTVATSLAQKIDGNSSIALGQYESITVQANGANWFIVSRV